MSQNGTSDGSKGKSVELDRSEVAIVVGEDGPNMSVRVVPGHDLADDVEEVPPAHEIAIAIAMRLLRDPDFHEEMLDWYYNQPDEEDEEEERQ